MPKFRDFPDKFRVLLGYFPLDFGKFFQSIPLIPFLLFLLLLILSLIYLCWPRAGINRGRASLLERITYKINNFLTSTSLILFTALFLPQSFEDFLALISLRVTWEEFLDVIVVDLSRKLSAGSWNEVIHVYFDYQRRDGGVVGEENHILIFGWSSKLSLILENLGRIYKDPPTKIVILSTRKKEDMEKDIRSFGIRSLDPKRVICRSGSYESERDLREVSFTGARSIIVLSEFEDPIQSDGRVLSIVARVMSMKNELSTDMRMVVELKNQQYESMIFSLGWRNGVQLIETFVVGEILPFLIRCATSSAMIQFWKDLLDFKVSIQCTKCPSFLVNKNFQEASTSFRDAIPIGFVRNGDGNNPVVKLKPEPNEVLEGDIIFILLHLDGNQTVTEELPENCFSPWFLEMNENDRNQLPTYNSLICGSGNNLHKKIRQLNEILPRESTVHVVPPIPQQEIVSGIENRENRRSSVTCLQGTPLSPDILNQMGGNWADFNSVLILADSGTQHGTVQAIDEQTNLALSLVLQAITSTTPDSTTNKYKCLIICEMFEKKISTANFQMGNRDLHYIFTNELSAMVIALISKDKLINVLFKEVFRNEHQSRNGG